MSEQKTSEDLDFEQLMQQRINENFNVSADQDVKISDERLEEMSKKLPEWSLEPPYSFLK